MKGKQVVFHLVRRLVLIRSICICGAIMQNLILAILAIPEWEDVIAALDDKQGEVEVGQLEVDVADLTHGLLRLGGHPLRLIV